MPDLHLACLTLEYPPDKGGVASYLQGLTSSLPGRVDIVRARTRSRWPRWWPIVQQCRTSSAQLLLISHLLPAGTAAWLARRWGGPAYVLVVHGMDVLLASRSCWKRWLARAIVKNAALIIANSNYTAGLLRARFQREALVLTPGYTPRSLPTREAARARLGFSAHENIVLSVGRLVSRKGFDTLIEACRELPATLVIVGNGPDGERLRGLVHQAPNVRLITSASDEERDAWYAAADVFALLVREEEEDVEGFGIVYLEAAAAGLPIVAGRSGGVAEAVEDTVTGRLVDPRAPHEATRALRFCLEHKQVAKDMGQAGARRVQKYFSWNDRAQALMTHLPFISVVIPVFNRATAFRRCLAALAKQTYRYREIIVVDDGSQENIESVANEFITTLPIHYLRQDNQGAPQARNRGFQAAKGTHILFLDADVILAPFALEDMARAASHPEADVVYGDHRFGWKRFYGRPFALASLEKANFIHTTSLIRREAFPGFDVSLRRFQDWDLWLTMAHQGSRFVWLPRVLFRVETGGTMSAWLPSFVHRFPWKSLGWMPNALKRYKEAERMIKSKHLIP